jgi:cardiolipin synthase
LLVDFDAFWKALACDLSAAREYAFVQTFSFEGDRVGQLLANALIQSGARDKRILADSFSKVVLSDKLLYSPGNWFNSELSSEVKATRTLQEELRANGVAIKHCNPLGPSPRRLFGRNHKKLVVIDDRVAYIGGINFSEHNAAWHDMMLRIEDESIARFLCEDFSGCWEVKSVARSKHFPGINLHSLNGRRNHSAFDQVIRLIEGAQDSIFIASPYISFPFYDCLRDARRRGVSITMLTPRTNNWRYFTDYARWESARCGINLRLYAKGMSHLKAMLVDDRYLIAGSSNFDFLSYRVYEEIVAIISEPNVIADFRERVMIPDLRDSVGVEDQVESDRWSWAGLRLKLFNKGLTVLLE